MVLFLSVPMATAGDPSSVRDLSFFLGRLRTVDHMPELEASHTAMSSTWDRTGGNADGNDFKNVREADRGRAPAATSSWTSQAPAASTGYSWAR